MAEGWKTLEKETVYRNPFISLREDRVIDPNGNRTSRNLLDIGSSIVIIPRDGNIFFLNRQERYAVGEESLEFPNGGIEDGESTLEAAERELEEELGLTAEEFSRIGTFHILNSLIPGEVHVVLAEKVHETKETRNSDSYEKIRREALERKELEKKLENEVKDSYTLAAWSKYSLRNEAD